MSGHLRTRLRHTPLRRLLVWCRHQGLHSEDVFLGGYPRSGSTWTRFLLYDLLTGREPDYDEVNRAIPDVGKHRAAPALLPAGGRLLKTHEPYRSEYRRAICLLRDPRDVALSEYRFWRMRRELDGTMEEFVEAFLSRPLHGFQTWKQNVDSWLTAAERGPDEGVQILLVRYEDLRSDTTAILQGMLSFLGVEPSRDGIQRAIDRNRLSNMARKAAANARTGRFQRLSGYRFINKGQIGRGSEALGREPLERLLAVCGATMERAGYEPGAAHATPAG